MAYRVFTNIGGQLAGEGSAYINQPLDIPNVGASIAKSRERKAKQKAQTLKAAEDFKPKAWERQLEFFSEQVRGYKDLVRSNVISGSRENPLVREDEYYVKGLIEQNGSNSLQNKAAYEDLTKEANQYKSEDPSFEYDAFTSYYNEQINQSNKYYAQTGQLSVIDPPDLQNGLFYNVGKATSAVLDGRKQAIIEAIDEQGGLTNITGNKVNVGGNVYTIDPETGKPMFGVTNRLGDGTQTINSQLVRSFYDDFSNGAKNAVMLQGNSIFEKKLNEGIETNADWLRQKPEYFTEKKDGTIQYNRAKIEEDWKDGELAIPYQTSIEYEGVAPEGVSYIDEAGNRLKIEGEYTIDDMWEVVVAEQINRKENRSVKTKNTSKLTSTGEKIGAGNREVLNNVSYNPEQGLAGTFTTTDGTGNPITNQVFAQSPYGAAIRLDKSVDVPLQEATDGSGNSLFGYAKVQNVQVSLFPAKIEAGKVVPYFGSGVEFIDADGNVDENKYLKHLEYISSKKESGNGMQYFASFPVVDKKKLEGDITYIGSNAQKASAIKRKFYQDNENKLSKLFALKQEIELKRETATKPDEIRQLEANMFLLENELQTSANVAKLDISKVIDKSQKDVMKKVYVPWKLIGGNINTGLSKGNISEKQIDSIIRMGGVNPDKARSAFTRGKSKGTSTQGYVQTVKPSPPQDLEEAQNAFE